jgi:hypothetical protein
MAMRRKFLMYNLQLRRRADLQLLVSIAALYCDAINKLQVAVEVCDAYFLMEEGGWLGTFQPGAKVRCNLSQMTTPANAGGVLVLHLLRER